MTNYLIKVTYEIEIKAPNENVAFDRAGDGTPRGAEIKSMAAVKVGDGLEVPTNEEGR